MSVGTSMGRIGQEYPGSSPVLPRLFSGESCPNLMGTWSSTAKGKSTVWCDFDQRFLVLVGTNKYEMIFFLDK